MEGRRGDGRKEVMEVKRWWKEGEVREGRR
jgi:hypothetical protein